jgi:hypothetical protein
VLSSNNTNIYYTIIYLFVKLKSTTDTVLRRSCWASRWKQARIKKYNGGFVKISSLDFFLKRQKDIGALD